MRISIQCPAANQALVGIKPTFGLVPNTGVVPLGGSTRDVIGPIARTVRDAAIALDVLAGYTPADPKTVAAIGKLPAGGYSAGLKSASLKGKRIGTFGPGWLAVERHRLDALVFPQSIAEPPLLHSKEFGEQTTVSQINIGGFPAIIVPAGAYPSGTPFAAIFVGRLWDEARLLALAFAYEQQSPMRRAPTLVLNPAELSRSGQ